MDIVIDTHQHFWDPTEFQLPALPTEMAVLDRAYLPRHLEGELRAVGVTHTVYVQGFPQNLRANEWMFRIADSTEFVAGVVAWLDLENPARVPAVLDELQGRAKFVGIRHIVENESDDAWILRAPVVKSLRELSRRGVAYDMLIRPRHLGHVLRLLDRVPDLNTVIDHIAKPAIRTRDSAEWGRYMTIIAQNHNVFCKLSGMITEADWRTWKASDLCPYVAKVIEVFSWDRVMFGSDWPVCLLAGTYQQTWDAIHEALGNLTTEQHRNVVADNATRFYRLKIDRVANGAVGSIA